MNFGNRILGTGSAILSSATFGFAPFFTLGLLAVGLGPCEVLSYRWGIAALFLTLVGLFTGHDFRLKRTYWGVVFWLSILRALTSFCLVIAYANIASGTASTIHFIYPLAVAAAMMLFFKEKFSLTILLAILTSIVGASLLSINGAETPEGNTTLGMVTACMSVFAYGGYMIGVKNTRATEIDSMVLTCYVMGIGALFFIVGGFLTGGVRLVSDWSTWLDVLGLAIPATAISNIALVWGIKRIGPTLTSFFGAFEPLTAVVIGILVFNEPFSWLSGVGIALVIVAVSIAALKRPE